MKLVLFGHTGLLGTEVARSLQYRYEVVFASRHLGIDISRSESFHHLPDNVDAVINCAAILNISDANFLRAFEVNVQGALNIAEYAKRSEAHMIHMSSTSAIKHPDNQYYGPYGAMKLCAAESLQQFADMNQLALTLLQLPQLYDFAGKAKLSQPALYRIINQLKQDGEVAIYGRLDPIRNYLNILDAASLVSEIVERRVTGNFHCCHPQNTCISDIVFRLAELLGKEAKLRFLPDKDNLKTIYVPREKSLWQILNYLPQHSLQQDLEKMVEQNYE